MKYCLTIMTKSKCIYLRWNGPANGDQLRCKLGILVAQDLHLAIVLFPIGSRRSAASSASRLFLGMGGGGDITVVAADDDDVPVDRTATKDTHLFCEFGFTFWTLPAVQYVHV